jgi:hypothetical protein
MQRAEHPDDRLDHSLVGAMRLDPQAHVASPTPREQAYKSQANEHGHRREQRCR